MTIVVLTLLLAPWHLEAQDTEKDEPSVPEVTVGLDTPLFSDLTLKVVDKDGIETPSAVNIPRSNTGTTDAGFPATIALSSKLVQSSSVETAGQALHLATGAFERITDSGLLKTDHMRSTVGKIGSPKSIGVKMDLAADQ